ncbi:hypothetical protein B296_00015655 [Ensete ventricosum]|uniref:RRM domain-containing protein n=1 Tax=Ensete ventricosum TaxID=4639 RepID=A0A427AMZ1_ENSVE|nr:hypothetical protein B296_00015655 [Ensete ventricosum]
MKAVLPKGQWLPSICVLRLFFIIYSKHCINLVSLLMIIFYVCLDIIIVDILYHLHKDILSKNFGCRIAYMDFKDQDAFSQALELNGSELGGYTLMVEEAKPRSDNRDGGWSGGRGGGRDSGGRGGGRFGGRGGGGRGGRGGGGRGRGGGGRGRGGMPNKHSAGTASTGKKTTFGDD